MPASAPAPKPGKKHSLAVGKPVGNKLYAKLVDQPTVFKINKSVVENLQPKVVDLRVKKVLSLAADEVAGVLVELTDATASLVKVEDQWQMIAPQKGQAENNAVSDLLDDVADLKAENFKDEVAALSVYGLDKPAGKLTFRLAGKDETVTLLIGGQSPSGEMTFVKSATGVAVAVVRTADAKKLLAPPATYWDRTILKLPDEANVTRLQLRRTDGTYTLARDANDKWALLTPIAAEADTDQVNKVIDKLEDLAADKIVSVGPDVPEAYAKSADTMQVVVTSETAAPEPASKPATQPATQATRPATRPTTKPTTQASQPTTTKPAPKPIVAQHQITVAKVGVGEFAPSLYDDLVGGLRGKKIWTIVPDEIRGLKAVAGTDSLELKKDGKAWKYTADAYVKIDAEKVTKHLEEDLKELTATKFVTHAAAGDLKKYGLDKPWLRLTLTDAKGKTWALTVSHTGESKTKDRYATASTVPGVFVLAADTIDKLGKKLKDFKKE